MKRIRNAFEDKKAFIAYVTAGDPDLDTTKQIILTMDQSGVDMIDIGFPYDCSKKIESDLCQSIQRALSGGTTTEGVFQMISELRQSVRAPFVLQAHTKTIEDYGISKFMRKCKEFGIEGIIIPDLEYVEKTAISRDSDLFGVDLIPVLAPDTRERMAAIAKKAKGFVYCDATFGNTNKDGKVDLREIAAIVRSNTSIPCVMGFGITTIDQAKELARISDGVVISNGIVKATAEYGKDCIRPITDYVRTMKSALRQA